MKSRTALECFFVPKTVAVIGATEHEGSVGRTVMVNLRNGKFPGKVFAVNPKRSGASAFRAFQALPQFQKK